MKEIDQLLAGLPELHQVSIIGALIKIAKAKEQNSTALNLRSRGMVSEHLRLLIPYIQEIEGLERLDLSNNCLTFLPENIGLLSSLKVLDLENNELLEVSDNIGALVLLEALILRNNALEKIPNSLGFLKQLEALDLAQNQFTTIPKSVVLLTKLAKLSMSNNQLRAIPHYLGFLTNLEQLDLGGNQLRVIPDNIELLQYLRTFNLRNNALEVLPSNIGTMTSLETLDLRDNPKLQTLPHTITFLSPTFWLGLDWNRISTETLQMLQGHFDGSRIQEERDLVALVRTSGQLTRSRSLAEMQNHNRNKEQVAERSATNSRRRSPSR